jgi:hypothetical protein
MYSNDPQKKAFQNTSSMKVWSVGGCQTKKMIEKRAINKKTSAHESVCVCVCV